MLSGIATNPQYQNLIANAANGVTGILGNPVDTNVTAQPVTAQMAANTNLAPYMNPYQSSVINATIAGS